MTLTNWKRNAVLFIIGQFLSMFGSMLVQFAITWQITLETQSGLTMTLFTCAALLPMVFISPFAGVWADRYNRKHLIIIADAAIAIMTLFLAVAYMSGYRNIWLMLLVVAARSFGQGIQQPAVSAMIPQIVPKDSLLRFNAIQSSIQSLNMFASPMAAGALLTLMPIERIFFLDVITAVAGIAVILLFVKVSGTPRREPVQKGLRAYMDELRAGWRYIGSKPWLKLMILYSAFFSFFASPAALLSPLQTVRTFGDDVWRLTAIEITFSLGSAAIMKKAGNLARRLPADDGSSVMPLDGSYMDDDGTMLRLEVMDEQYIRLFYKGSREEMVACFDLGRKKARPGEVSCPVPGEGNLPYLGSFGLSGGVFRARVIYPTAPFGMELKLSVQGDELSGKMEVRGMQGGKLNLKKQKL